MKQLLILFFLFLISCTNNTECTNNSNQVEGAWTMTQSLTNGNCANSNGYLWSSLIFQGDSVLIADKEFFIGSNTRYKIEGDSIEFFMDGNPKYHFRFSNCRLHFKGYQMFRGCKFLETKTYERLEYEYPIKKILAQDSINNDQLIIERWCRNGVANIEKHVTAEISQFSKNLNDSSGIHYFPRELNFNSSNLNRVSNLKFLVEERAYSINHYNGSQLTILFESNDTSFYMQYDICESIGL